MKAIDADLINMDFQKIIEQEAAKRSLSVTDFAMDFHFERDCAACGELRITVWDEEEEMKFYLGDFTVEEAVSAIMDRYVTVSRKIYVRAAEYFAAARDYFLCDGCAYFKEIHGGVRYYVSLDDEDTYMITERYNGYDWDFVPNNFDAGVFMEFYKKATERYDTVQFSEMMLRTA
jgi:hypothetical protein